MISYHRRYQENTSLCVKKRMSPVTINITSDILYNEIIIII